MASAFIVVVPLTLNALTPVMVSVVALPLKTVLPVISLVISPKTALPVMVRELPPPII